MGPRTARRPDSCIDRYSIAKWKWGKLFKRDAALGENPPKPRATRPRRKRACRPAAHQSACAVGSPNATRQQPAYRAKRSPVKKNTRPAAQGRSCPLQRSRKHAARVRQREQRLPLSADRQRVRSVDAQVGRIERLQRADAVQHVAHAHGLERGMHRQLRQAHIDSMHARLDIRQIS